MSFSNMVGQLLQQGMAGQTRSRLDHAVGPQGLGGAGGIEQVLAGILGGGATSPGRPGSAGAPDLLSGLRDSLLPVFANKQVGGGGAGAANPFGGLGALAGSLLGGGGATTGGGGVGQSAMAVLGALAMNALQASTAAKAAGGRAPEPSRAPTAPQSSRRDETPVRAPTTAGTGEELERLLVKAMILAAKADGKIDEQEMERIAGKVGENGVTPEERKFLGDELRRPFDLAGLLAQVPDRVAAAEVYVASLLAIDVDTPNELRYLGQLAAGLDLDDTTVRRLHELTGTPV